MADGTSLVMFEEIMTELLKIIHRPCCVGTLFFVAYHSAGGNVPLLVDQSRAGFLHRFKGTGIDTGIVIF